MSHRAKIDFYVNLYHFKAFVSRLYAFQRGPILNISCQNTKTSGRRKYCLPLKKPTYISLRLIIMEMGEKEIDLYCFQYFILLERVLNLLFKQNGDRLLFANFS